MKIRVNSFIIGRGWTSIFSMGSRKWHFLYVVVSKMPLLVYTDIFFWYEWVKFWPFLVWVGQTLAIFRFSTFFVCGSLKNVLLYEGLENAICLYQGVSKIPFLVRETFFSMECNFLYIWVGKILPFLYRWVKCWLFWHDGSNFV